ncbi:MAG: FtsX-like permease family protein [Gemmatimonadota bacterium]|nr:FtsX-like permease family protein [Gemmatimonadota bacterium]
MDEFWEERPFATVVGVVGDARYTELVRAPGPVAYFPFSQRPRRLGGAATIVARSNTGTAAALSGTLREVLAASDPSIPPRFRSMEDRLQGSVSQRRFTMALIGAFALVALILAGIGIYGVVSFAVARRRREMGIRLALGGGKSQIRRMVQFQSMRSVILGSLIGLAGALALGRLLESALFGVDPTDPVTLALAATVLLAVAWGAATIPATRSTRVDPMVAMRSD